MKLVEIYLPYRKSSGENIAMEEFARIEQMLTEKFGGATSYHRNPAVGYWKSPEEEVEVDDIAVIEVMTDQFDRDWWLDLQRDLLTRFQQDELLIRISEVERL